MLLFIFLARASESTPIQTSLEPTEMGAQLTRQVFWSKPRSQRQMLMCGLTKSELPVLNVPQAHKDHSSHVCVSLNPEVEVL